ncbi:MAG: baseplate J/gp47 family protein [Candidatus Electrothrix sp. Rat3]|nr:baseplate J/gp47 family protein [Candidatus Electrothrix rattekaaiensis]
MERTKQHLNGFTKRHLDFYFQKILQMQKKKAVPDHVNVLIELAKQQESFLLPAGTLLHAGKDSAGKLLAYTTDEKTQLNHAQIAKLRAVYVDKQPTSIYESIQKAREEYLKNKENNEEIRQKAFIEMLKVALGRTELGYELPKYPLDEQENKKKKVDFKLLDCSYKRLEFIKNKLKLTFNEFNKKYNDIDERKKLEKSAKELDSNNTITHENKTEKLYNNIKEIESYFYITVDAFYFLIKVIKNTPENTDKWERIDSLLSAAYAKRTSSDRKKELAKLLGSKKESGLIARRKRELQEDIIAEKEEWQGLYAIEDVRKATVSNSVDAKNTAQRWKTFGQFSSDEESSEKKEKQQPGPAEFGLAISSPVLLLSQGERIITLTLGLNGTNEMFRVLASTEDEDGWIEASSLNINDEKEWIITFNADQKPIAAPKFGPFKGADWPILKIIFDDRNGKNNSGKYYQQFRKEILSNITISAEVKDLSYFTIWNDFQKLDCKKPFEPFGPKPVVGSRFYLSSSELRLKKITEIIFKNEWVNIDHLSDVYYQAYNAYNTKQSNNTKKIESKLSFNILIQTDNFRDNEEHALFKKNDNGYEVSFSKEGYVEKIYWELQNPDFQHSVYPALAAQKATELAVAIANGPTGIKAENYQINPPFTPVIKKLTLNYNASASLKENQNEIKLFHIHPFGYAEVKPVKDDEKITGYPFLPKYDRAGELYIGLENLKPPQHLSMLFQMAEGSADADMNPSPVYWDYLDGNEWLPLENGGVLHDRTRGLINSGIIKFALPAPEKPSTLLPSELYWLRASVRKRPDSVCDTVAIHTQAVSATLVDNDNAPDHFRQPLAKDSIKKLLHPLPAIKAVRQPYTSFGGKTAEEDKWFYTRVSERLRHKQRALTVWDYEHLVLERFPQIYKVKCIPANESRPGTVEIVVIPDIRNRLPADPFEPKAPANLLEDIQSYIEAMAPDSANIVVKNANYVPFLVRMGVRFRQGYEEGYHIDRLQDKLNRFLAPWAYTEGADIVFGGKIYASSIIDFVERLPYVDYLAQLNLFPTGLREGENSISAKESADVLVPERKHFIDAIPEGGYQFGINHMMIGLDFQVASNK